MSLYKIGEPILVRLAGHVDPVQMAPIVMEGFVAGGGVMLIADRGNGEVERIVQLLNEAEQRRSQS